jgi:CRP-like cAMP-binding protein
MEEPPPAIKLTRPTARLPEVAPNADRSGPQLPAVGILAGLSAQSLSNLCAYGAFESYPAAQEVIRQGARQEKLYVVVEGRLAVTVRRGAQEVQVSEAHAGECLGEVSLLEPGAASATVRTLETSVLWSLDTTGLRIFMGDHPGGAGAFLMGMASCLSARLREANRRICQHHMLPVETLPAGRERAITASNAPIQPGFFERLKQTIAIPKKTVRIPTKIKL